MLKLKNENTKFSIKTIASHTMESVLNIIPTLGSFKLTPNENTDVNEIKRNDATLNRSLLDSSFANSYNPYAINPATLTAIIDFIISSFIVYSRFKSLFIAGMFWTIVHPDRPEYQMSVCSVIEPVDIRFFNSSSDNGPTC